MSLSGVTIKQGALGANTRGSADSISALLMTGPEPTNGLKHDTPTPIYSLKDADLLGINAKYDTDNNVIVYRHIYEFFRMAGEGTKLWISIADTSKNKTDLLTDTGASKNDSAAKKLIIAGDGEIKQLAVATTPASAPTYENKISTDVKASIPLAQGIAQWAEGENFPCEVLIEGRDWEGTASATQDLRDPDFATAPNVSVVLGQDWSYAESLPEKDGSDDLYLRTYADVGTALGTLASAGVNQNIGQVNAYNLTDATRSAWLVAGLSNHTTIEDSYDELNTLHTKGYVFGMTYAGVSGVRWNDDPTCVEVIQDATGNMNNHSLALSRTLHKAMRLLRQVYIQEVKKSIALNDDGEIDSGAVAYLNSVGENILSQMQTNGEISQSRVSVDPESDLLVEKVLDVSFELIPRGIIGTIKGTINLKTSL